MHFTSHAHDAPHVTVLHDCTPLHSTSHALVPHCTFWHEFLPMHSTMHLVVPAQTTPLRHELSMSHLTSHEYPIGHVTVPLQSAPPWQSITHVFWLTLQLVHCLHAAVARRRQRRAAERDVTRRRSACDRVAAGLSAGAPHVARTRRAARDGLAGLHAAALDIARARPALHVLARVLTRALDLAVGRAGAHDAVAARVVGIAFDVARVAGRTRDGVAAVGPPWQSITQVFWLTLQLVHCAGQALLPLPLP